ncbi:MAG: hypothetical protein R2788_19660 [Saprospiraceae bacterium]
MEGYQPGDYVMVKVNDATSATLKGKWWETDHVFLGLSLQIFWVI